jgi:hypothetical protein
MLNLPDVTLLCYSDIELEATLKSFEISTREISFGAVKWISSVKPYNLPEWITWEFAPEIKNIDDFNSYFFFNLYWHVETSHVLTIQHHAYILNPEMWDDNWLRLDYLGAPWPIKENAYICHDLKEHVRVGNGGFSLRSRYLLSIPKVYRLPLLREQGWANEDGNICVYHRKKMLELFVKYGTVEQAARFSYETPMDENDWGKLKTFGFHRNLA